MAASSPALSAELPPSYPPTSLHMAAARLTCALFVVQCNALRKLRAQCSVASGRARFWRCTAAQLLERSFARLAEAAIRAYAVRAWGTRVLSAAHDHLVATRCPRAMRRWHGRARVRAEVLAAQRRTVHVRVARAFAQWTIANNGWFETSRASPCVVGSLHGARLQAALMRWRLLVLRF